MRYVRFLLPGLIALATLMSIEGVVGVPVPAQPRCDFDGDWYGDLAIAAPLEDVGAIEDAGAVNVLYGSTNGLTATGDQMWTQNSPGVLGGAEARDGFGNALACGDFNGDSYDDLAIGAPYEDVGDIDNAGLVNVLYGSDEGLKATDDQVWHQDSPSVWGHAEAQDEFGGALSSGDFNGDGKDDLAIGVIGEDIGAIDDAGAVNVLYGSTNGLTADNDQLWHQNSPGIQGGAEAWDQFGAALTSGDFNGDFRDDLAVGVRSEAVGAIVNAGMVNVLYGSDTGLKTADDQVWHQNSPGVQGGAETGDRFGSALTSGDYDGDGYHDLAVGAFLEDVGAVDDAGMVNILYGSDTGLTATDDQVWTQNSPGVQGGAEPWDYFGRALSSGDFDSDVYDDLAVGASWENVGDVYDAGMVNVLYGTGSGLTATDDQVWHQNTPGVWGGAEAQDEFGRALSSNDFDGDGKDDLAIGAPHEDIGAISDAGAVNVLYGSWLGLTTVDDQMWHQNSPGIWGGAETGDWFGRALEGRQPD